MANPKPMNSVERRELGKIIKSEFETLLVEATNRLDDEYEVKEIQLREAHQDELKKINEAADKWRQKARKLEEEMRGFVSSSRVEGYMLVGSTRQGYGQGAVGSLVTFQQNNAEFTSQALEDEVLGLKRDLQRAKRDILTLIHRKEVEVLKDLSLTALETEGAKEFMSKIPDAAAIIDGVKPKELA